MFKLKKLYPPLGSRDNPFIETSYAEGAIPVVDGLCEVRLPETRDRLLKLGYQEEVLVGSPEPAPPEPPQPKPAPKRGRR
jgi:hypothetical protein